MPALERHHDQRSRDVEPGSSSERVLPITSRRMRHRVPIEVQCRTRLVVAPRTVECQNLTQLKLSWYRRNAEIWALMVGPGIAKNQVVDKVVQQSSITATVGRLMGFETRLAEGSVLGDALL